MRRNIIHRNKLNKKVEYFNTKLTENIGKRNKLWKSLKSLGLASINSPLTNVCLETKDDITNFDSKKNANIFKILFCTIPDDLVANFPPPFLRFGFNSVRQYYEKILKYSKSKFKFHVVSEETILKLFKDLDENKAAGLDNLSGIFLKDGASVLGRTISEICNLSIKYSIFPSDCKITKLKSLFRKSKKTDPKIIVLYPNLL